jgi:sodium-dependent phosphate cotransporter
MGSNMGTTITNTLAALGNLREDEAFNRSFAAATVHDFFNLFTILIFLPLELLFHPLEYLSRWMARWIYGSADVSVGRFDFIRLVTRPAINVVRDGIRQLPANISGLVMIIVGISLVLLSVYLLNQVLHKVMTGRAERIFRTAVGKNSALAMLSGLVVTLIVQSSTLTTVLIVPLAGAGVMSLAQVYPFTLGANIGTPITALMSATAISGEYQSAALQIALVHLLYNALAVFVFACVPPLWRLPIQAAQALANGATRSRVVVPAYILGVFFVIPGIVFAGQSIFNNKSSAVVEAEQKAAYQPLQNEVEAKEMVVE